MRDNNIEPSLFAEDYRQYPKGKKRTAFTDYDAFVEKFKDKKTTDDCYTPQDVYDLILDHCRKEWFGTDGYELERPFWPGADFKKHPYKPNSLVFDNPPFSILSHIVAWYIKHGIHFLLFAPALTLFSRKEQGVTYIVTNTQITYANGAKISTGFVTDMYDHSVRVLVDGNLQYKIRELQAGKADVSLPRIDLPDEVTTAARLNKYCRIGVKVEISKADSRFISKIGKEQKQLYGGGLLLRKAEAARLAEAARKRETYELTDKERAWVDGADM